MSARTVFISAYQRGRLYGLSSTANLPALAHLPRFDAERLAFASLLQSGAEYLDLAPISVPEPLNKSILGQRIRPHNRRVYEHNAATVDAVFRSHLPEGCATGHRFSTVWEARSLLSDLFYAAQVGRSVGWSIRISSFSGNASAERDTLLDVLPAHVALPVLNLLRSVRLVEAECVVPRRGLQRDGVERLGELMSSDLFRSYRQGHDDLAQVGSDPVVAARGIGVVARDLWKRFRPIVNLRRTTIGLLPAVPKIVEAGFGALPGAIAERASEAAGRLLRRRASILIYDMSFLLDEVGTHRLGSLLDRPDAVERLGQLMEEIRSELRDIQSHLQGAPESLT